MNIGENYICLKSIDQFKIGQIYTISKIIIPKLPHSGRQRKLIFKFNNCNHFFTKDVSGNIVNIVNTKNNKNLFTELRTYNLNIINEMI